MATEGTNLSGYNKSLLPNGEKFRIGIVVSQWNADITSALYKGAFDTLLDLGVKPVNIIKWEVPGSFELVYGSKKMQEQMVNVVIAIGSVIQGETKHFDFVCEAVAQGIKDLNVNRETPVIFCVLTDNNKQQSIDRSGGKYGNKGVEAAVAAVQMADLRHKA